MADRFKCGNDYFKGNATIYAVDINPECKKFENE